MKTIMNNNTIANALTGLIFVSILTVGAFSMVPAAQAQEFDGGDYSGGCCDTGWSDVGSGYDTPSYNTSDTGWYDVGSGYSTPTDTSNTGWYDVGSGYSNPSSYSTSGYSGSGYSTSGYTAGGYTIGTGGYSYSVPKTSVYTLPSPNYSVPSSNIYAPTNTWDNGNTNIFAPTTVTTDSHNIAETSYCSGSNNCNTSSNTVTNNTWSPPAVVSTPTPVVYNYPVQPACYTCSCNTTYCQHAPVVYQQTGYNTATPYVSLTQVPYTGLDLGFWGTVAYWGFMVGFALVVAYLIAIKRVQNRIARSLKHFLFGSVDEEEVVVAHVHAAPAAVAHVTSAEQTSSEDVIDSFILAQVNRPRHA